MSPDVAFHGQPFDPDRTVRAFLERALADPAIARLTIVVAWARYRGFGQLKEAIETFRARGGQIEAVVGIDEGGATRPGLLGLVRLTDRAHVFHDEDRVTFHPKLYLAEGPATARLLVGSSNATAGGLAANYEASVEVGFALPQEAQAPALQDARRYVERLIGDRQACRPLDEALVDELVRTRRYRVEGHERREEAPRLADGRSERPLFARGRARRARSRRLSAAARAELAALELAPEPSQPLAPPAASASPVVASWSKRLSRTDAQQPGRSPRWRPVGSLRLNRGRHPIDHLTWFRRDLFGAADWRAGLDSKRNPIEVASVEFDVRIAGTPARVVRLRVDHGPHREEGQNNVTTILHWDELLPDLRATDYSGRTVTIDRLADGSYRLTIA